MGDHGQTPPPLFRRSLKFGSIFLHSSLSIFYSQSCIVRSLGGTSFIETPPAGSKLTILKVPATHSCNELENYKSLHSVNYLLVVCQLYIYYSFCLFVSYLANVLSAICWLSIKMSYLFVSYLPAISWLSINYLLVVCQLSVIYIMLACQLYISCLPAICWLSVKYLLVVCQLYVSYFCFLSVSYMSAIC